MVGGGSSSGGTPRWLRSSKAKGWYRVSDAVAARLAPVHPVPNDEDTPLGFDVFT